MLLCLSTKRRRLSLKDGSLKPNTVVLAARYDIELDPKDERLDSIGCFELDLLWAAAKGDGSQTGFTQCVL